jgi:hypothetical protein
VSAGYGVRHRHHDGDVRRLDYPTCATHQTGYVVIGSLVGWRGGIRLWNRWNR